MKQSFQQGLSFFRGISMVLLKFTLKFTACLLFFLVADTLSAQTEIQVAVTGFFNDVIIPVGGVLVTIATFGGLVYSAILFSRGSPNAGKVLFGVIAGAIVFYGGGLILSNLFSKFGSSYTIAFLDTYMYPLLNDPLTPNLPALV